jgi:hypothetical protein
MANTRTVIARREIAYLTSFLKRTLFEIIEAWFQNPKKVMGTDQAFGSSSRRHGMFKRRWTDTTSHPSIILL